jgi:hypothetical protein
MPIFVNFCLRASDTSLYLEAVPDARKMIRINYELHLITQDQSQPKPYPKSTGVVRQHLFLNIGFQLVF